MRVDSFDTRRIVRRVAPLAARNIAVRDMLHKVRAGVKQQDMEVLHSVDRLETRRVLEPCVLWFLCQLSLFCSPERIDTDLVS
jgi:hypothetical protein